jgi:hypothetical protein
VATAAGCQAEGLRVVWVHTARSTVWLACAKGLLRWCTDVQRLEVKVLPRWVMPLLLWRTCSRVTNTPKKSAHQQQGCSSSCQAGLLH